MNTTKPATRSKTNFSLLLLLITQAFQHLGIDIDLLAFAGFEDGGLSLTEVLTLVLVIAAAIARYVARDQLRGFFK